VKLSVCTLDLATVTGWALHNEDLERPFFGALRLPGSAREVGQRCSALWDFLEDKHAIYRFTHIVRESQHIAAPSQPADDKPARPGRKKKSFNINMDTANCLICLGGAAEMFAFRHRIKFYETPIQTWRKHFLGRGAGFKRDAGGDYLPGENPKELAIRKCAEYGWHTDSADAAEACGILDHFLSLVPDYHRPWRDFTLMGGIRA
jgi:hypothetical protein